MIIFGSRTMTSSRGGGVFHCPRCSMQRNYDHKQLNRWFTLYFIPCIPMGSAGDYIECISCGGTYGSEVLSYDPAADRAETYELIRRLVVLALVKAQRMGPENIAALRNAMQDLTGDFVTEEQIHDDARHAQQANVHLAEVFRSQGSDFNADGKVYLLQVTRDCLAAGGELGSIERQTLDEAAGAIGVPRDIVDQIVTRPQQ